MEEQSLLQPCNAQENLTEDNNLNDLAFTDSDAPVKKLDLQEPVEELDVIYPPSTPTQQSDDLPVNLIFDRKCLSNHPVAFFKLTDTMPVKEYFQQGEDLYLQDKYSEALSHYINYVLKSARNNSWTVHGYSAIVKSREIFNDIYKLTIQDINDPNNAENNFFRTVAYIRDNHKTLDSSLVQNKITRPIPLVSRQSFKEIMGQLGENIVPKPIPIGPYTVAVHELQGRRPTMEDKHLATSFIIQQKNKPAQEVYLFGVFDGHSGTNCANFICMNICGELKRNLDKSDDLSDVTIFNSLKMGCVETNNRWLEVVKKSMRNISGSTGCMIFIVDQTAWCINVGDSRAILAKNDKLFQCSQDAKPNEQPFLNSILKRGGYVKYNEYGFRLNANLAVGRAFGDCYELGMTARPKITKWDLKDLTSGYFIIACDGMWDVLGGNHVQELENREIAGLNRTPTIEELPYYLGQIAYAKGSTDNITVMSINLSPKNIPKTD